MPISVWFAVAAALILAVLLTLWPDLTVVAPTIRRDTLLAAVGFPVLWILFDILRGMRLAWRRWSSRPYF
jgi:hypothetical protein